MAETEFPGKILFSLKRGLNFFISTFFIRTKQRTLCFKNGSLLFLNFLHKVRKLEGLNPHKVRKPDFRKNSHSAFFGPNLAKIRVFLTLLGWNCVFSFSYIFVWELMTINVKKAEFPRKILFGLRKASTFFISTFL